MPTPSHFFLLLFAGLTTLLTAEAYRVNIADTDSMREVCTGMYGGKEAYIEMTFDQSSTGQLALVIYEWSDVAYLGIETPDESISGSGDLPRTYICTTSAIRSGLCSKNSLGQFITSVPPGVGLNETSIFTEAIRFNSSPAVSVGSGAMGGEGVDSEEDEEATYTNSHPSGGTKSVSSPGATARPGSGSGSGSDRDTDAGNDDKHTPDNSFEPIVDDNGDVIDADDELMREINEQLEQEEEDERLAEELALSGLVRRQKIPKLRLGIVTEVQHQQRKRQEGTSDLAIEMSVPPPALEVLEDFEETDPEDDKPVPPSYASPAARPTYGDGLSGSSSSSQVSEVPIYDSPIIYAVPKTGYYCVGIVPVTLVNSAQKRQVSSPTSPQPNHAAYSGSILFKNTFNGELPAAEYPKIGFYLVLSTVYALVAIGWGLLCMQFVRELLPMQYYISGTMAFLVVEMLANFAYYRYLNKHGAGTTSLVFLFVVAILNAGRNSISFFLLLIVSMGLSVVTPSLGPVMNRVRLLTIIHFIFGVLYSVGTVSIELETANLVVVMLLIFPLALTLTAFLMWTIISLNGTILHLSARKQTHKLGMYRKLYRILLISVIAVAAFFVISTLSLSSRFDEDYAPNHWRYRWILLDGSLAIIYLCAFVACAWIFRPTRDNVRFSMSQELAQEDQDADDYEMGHSAHQLGDDEDDDENNDRPPSYSNGNGEDRRAKDRYDDEEGEEDQFIRNGQSSRRDEGHVMFSLEEVEDEDALAEGEGDIGGSGAEEFRKKMKADKND